MKKYYKILGLEEGATKAEIEKKYKELSKEYDPKNNDNQEFFKEEYKKVQEAYEALITSSILNNPGKGSKIKPSNSQTSVSDDETTEPDDNPVPLTNKPVKRENNIFRNALLFFIATGVWAIFLQNIGFFVQREDYIQKVRVVNTVDTKVKNTVSAYVDNTVDINIDEINGYSNVFYRQDGKYFLLPTYSPN